MKCDWFYQEISNVLETTKHTKIKQNLIFIVYEMRSVLIRNIDGFENEQTHQN